MSGIPLFCKRFHAMKRNGPNGASNTNPALTITDAVEEHREMAECHSYGDSTPSNNQNKEQTWQSLGDLAARLVDKAKQERGQ